MQAGRAVPGAGARTQGDCPARQSIHTQVLTFTFFSSSKAVTTYLDFCVKKRKLGSSAQMGTTRSIII